MVIMSDLIREAALGQLLRWATNNRLFPYPEELPGFEIPESYKAALNPEKKPRRHSSSQAQADKETGAHSDEPSASSTDSESDHHHQDIEQQRTLSRQNTLQYTPERLEADSHEAVERVVSKPISPIKTSDGIVLVDWYTTDDPANPQNWSLRFLCHSTSLPTG